MPADFADRTDFENTERGLLARFKPGVIKAPEQRGFFDAEAYSVVDANTEVANLAPHVFKDHAVSENVYAGTAMLRRGEFLCFRHVGANCMILCDTRA